MSVDYRRLASSLAWTALLWCVYFAVIYGVFFGARWIDMTAYNRGFTVGIACSFIGSIAWDLTKRAFRPYRRSTMMCRQRLGNEDCD